MPLPLAGALQVGLVLRVLGAALVEGGERPQPHPQLGDAFGELLTQSAGKECRITNAHGTDISFTLGKPEGFAFARATKPGGYFVPGTVMMVPEMESVVGSVVTSNMFHEYYTELAEPMTLKIDGKVKEVIGGAPENKVMRRALGERPSRPPRNR